MLQAADTKIKVPLIDNFVFSNKIGRTPHWAKLSWLHVNALSGRGHPNSNNNKR